MIAFGSMISAGRHPLQDANGRRGVNATPGAAGLPLVPAADR
jgi:hypothetical protein